MGTFYPVAFVAVEANWRIVSHDGYGSDREEPDGFGGRKRPKKGAGGCLAKIWGAWREAGTLAPSSSPFGTFSDSATGIKALGLVNAVIPNLTDMIGAQCSPFTVVGVSKGGSWYVLSPRDFDSSAHRNIFDSSSTPVCCENNYSK